MRNLEFLFFILFVGYTCNNVFAQVLDFTTVNGVRNNAQDFVEGFHSPWKIGVSFGMAIKNVKFVKSFSFFIDSSTVASWNTGVYGLNAYIAEFNTGTGTITSTTWTSQSPAIPVIPGSIVGGGRTFVKVTIKAGVTLDPAKTYLWTLQRTNLTAGDALWAKAQTGPTSTWVSNGGNTFSNMQFQFIFEVDIISSHLYTLNFWRQLSTISNFHSRTSYVGDWGNSAHSPFYCMAIQYVARLSSFSFWVDTATVNAYVDRYNLIAYITQFETSTKVNQATPFQAQFPPIVAGQPTVTTGGVSFTKVTIQVNLELDPANSYLLVFRARNAAPGGLLVSEMGATGGSFWVIDGDAGLVFRGPLMGIDLIYEINVANRFAYDFFGLSGLVTNVASRSGGIPGWGISASYGFGVQRIPYIGSVSFWVDSNSSDYFNSLGYYPMRVSVLDFDTNFGNTYSTAWSTINPPIVYDAVNASFVLGSTLYRKITFNIDISLNPTSSYLVTFTAINLDNHDYSKLTFATVPINNRAFWYKDASTREEYLVYQGADLVYEVNMDMTNSSELGGIYNPANGCSSVAAAANGTIPTNKVYYIYVSGKVVPVMCDFTMFPGKAATLVFKLNAGIAGDAAALWSQATPTNDDISNALPHLNTARTSRHYVSRLLSQWANVTQVALRMYIAENTVKFVNFNAQGSDLVNWFTSSRVTSSSWSDFMQTSNLNVPGNFFDINANNYQRYWFKSTSYGECPNDRGHFVVLSYDEPCASSWFRADKTFPTSAPVPNTFLYSPGTTDAPFANAGRAEVFAVWAVLDQSNSEPTPPLLGDGPTNPASSCNQILNQRPDVTTGVYYIKDNNRRTVPALCDFNIFPRRAATLLYKVSKGIPSDSLRLWTLASSDNNINPTNLNTMRSTSVNYVSSLYNSTNWKNNVQVSVRVHTDGVLKQYVNFKNADSNLTSWFDGSNVIGSSWNDIPTSKSNPNVGLYFSPNPYGNRQWYINNNFGGCNAEAGWLMLANGADSCKWAYGTSGIWYSPLPTKATSATGFVSADVFSIWADIPDTDDVLPVGDVPTKPALSCNDVLRKRPGTLSDGIYYVMQTPTLRTIPVLCSFTIFGAGQVATLLAKFSAGVAAPNFIQGIYNGPALNVFGTEVLKTTNNYHYVSSMMASWTHSAINTTSVRLYKGGVQVHYIDFEANSDKQGWFSADMVKKSSWLDIPRFPSEFEGFAFDLSGTPSSRTFYINKDRTTCADSVGWLNMITGPDSCSSTWLPDSPAPLVITYSPLNISSLSTGFARADVLAIWGIADVPTSLMFRTKTDSMLELSNSTATGIHVNVVGSFGSNPKFCIGTVCATSQVTLNYNGTSTVVVLDLELNCLSYPATSQWTATGVESNWMVVGMELKDSAIVINSILGGPETVLTVSKIYWTGEAIGHTTDYFDSNGGFSIPARVLFDSWGINSMEIKFAYTIPNHISIYAEYQLLDVSGKIDCDVGSPALVARTSYVDLLWNNVRLGINLSAFQYDHCAASRNRSAYLITGTYAGTPWTPGPGIAPTSTFTLLMYGATNVSAGSNTTNSTDALSPIFITTNLTYTTSIANIPANALSTIFGGNNFTTGNDQNSSVVKTQTTLSNVHLVTSTSDFLVSLVIYNHNDCLSPISGNGNGSVTFDGNRFLFSSIDVSLYHCAAVNRSFARANSIYNIWTIKTTSVPKEALTVENLVIKSVGFSAYSVFASNDAMVYFYTLTGTSDMFSGKVPITVETTYTSNSSNVQTYLNMLYDGYVISVNGSINYKYNPNCAVTSPGAVNLNITALDQLMSFTGVSFIYSRCGANGDNNYRPMSITHTATNVDFEVAGFGFGPYPVAFTLNSYLKAGISNPTLLGDAVRWQGTIFGRPQFAFDNVTITLDSDKGVTGINAKITSLWSPNIKYGLSLQLNNSNFIPSFDNAVFTVKLGTHSITSTFNVGYLATGWNLQSYDDGSIVFPVPGKLPNSKYSVMNVTRDSADTLDLSDDNEPWEFEWMYPTSWGANTDMQVMWNATHVTSPTPSATFSIATNSAKERPVVIATSTLTVPFTIAGLTVYNGTMQMMGFYRTAIQLGNLVPNVSIITDDFLWQARMVAYVGIPDDINTRTQAIIEFNSINGMTSITLAMARVSPLFSFTTNLRMPLTQQACLASLSSSGTMSIAFSSANESLVNNIPVSVSYSACVNAANPWIVTSVPQVNSTVTVNNITVSSFYVILNSSFMGNRVGISSSQLVFSGILSGISKHLNGEVTTSIAFGDTSLKGVGSIGTISAPAAGCNEIKQENPLAINGVYYILSGRGVVPVLCDFSIFPGKASTLLYKLSAGVPGEANTLWFQATPVNEGNTNLLTVTRSSQHFVSHLIGNWSAVSQASVRLYNGGTAVKFVDFNTQGTDYINWYTASNVAQSSWIDFTSTYNPTISGSLFAIDPSSYGRFWFKSTRYDTCAGDRGHIVVFSGVEPCSPLWFGENVPPPNVFLYAPGTTDSLFANAARAEVFAVWGVVTAFAPLYSRAPITMTNWTYTYTNSSSFSLKLGSEKFAYCEAVCPPEPLSWTAPTTLSNFRRTTSCNSATLQFSAPATIVLHTHVDNVDTTINGWFSLFPCNRVADNNVTTKQWWFALGSAVGPRTVGPAQFLNTYSIAVNAYNTSVAVLSFIGSGFLYNMQATNISLMMSIAGYDAPTYSANLAYKDSFSGLTFNSNVTTEECTMTVSNFSATLNSYPIVGNVVFTPCQSTLATLQGSVVDMSTGIYANATLDITYSRSSNGVYAWEGSISGTARNLFNGRFQVYSAFRAKFVSSSLALNTGGSVNAVVPFVGTYGVTTISGGVINFANLQSNGTCTNNGNGTVLLSMNVLQNRTFPATIVWNSCTSTLTISQTDKFATWNVSGTIFYDASVIYSGSYNSSSGSYLWSGAISGRVLYNDIQQIINGGVNFNSDDHLYFYGIRVIGNSVTTFPLYSSQSKRDSADRCSNTTTTAMHAIEAGDSHPDIPVKIQMVTPLSCLSTNLPSYRCAMEEGHYYPWSARRLPITVTSYESTGYHVNSSFTYVSGLIHGIASEMFSPINAAVDAIVKFSSNGIDSLLTKIAWSSLESKGASSWTKVEWKGDLEYRQSPAVSSGKLSYTNLIFPKGQFITFNDGSFSYNPNVHQCHSPVVSISMAKDESVESKINLGPVELNDVNSLAFSLTNPSKCEKIPSDLGLTVANGYLTGTTTSLFNGVPSNVGAEFDQQGFTTAEVKFDYTGSGSAMRLVATMSLLHQDTCMFEVTSGILYILFANSEYNLPLNKISYDNCNNTWSLEGSSTKGLNIGTYTLLNVRVTATSQVQTVSDKFRFMGTITANDAKTGAGTVILFDSVKGITSFRVVESFDPYDDHYALRRDYHEIEVRNVPDSYGNNLLTFTTTLSNPDSEGYSVGTGSVHVNLYAGISINMEATISKLQANGMTSYDIMAYSASGVIVSSLLEFRITNMTFKSTPNADAASAVWNGAISGSTVDLIPDTVFPFSLFVSSNPDSPSIIHGFKVMLNWMHPSGTFGFEDVVLALDQALVFRKTCPTAPSPSQASGTGLIGDQPGATQFITVNIAVTYYMCAKEGEQRFAIAGSVENSTIKGIEVTNLGLSLVNYKAAATYFDFTGKIFCDLPVPNIGTTVAGSVDFSSKVGLTHFVAQVVYNNQENLNFTLNLDYYPNNCSALNTGSGSINLYNVGETPLGIDVSVAYNPCPSTLTEFPVWEITGELAYEWVINGDITIDNVKIHLIGEALETGTKDNAKVINTNTTWSAYISGLYYHNNFGFGASVYYNASESPSLQRLQIDYSYGTPSTPIFINSTLLYEDYSCSENLPQLSGQALTIVELESPLYINATASLNVCDDSFYLAGNQPDGNFVVYNTAISNLSITIAKVGNIYNGTLVGRVNTTNGAFELDLVTKFNGRTGLDRVNAAFRYTQPSFVIYGEAKYEQCEDSIFRAQGLLAVDLNDIFDGPVSGYGLVTYFGDCMTVEEGSNQVFNVTGGISATGVTFLGVPLTALIQFNINVYFLHSSFEIITYGTIFNTIANISAMVVVLDAETIFVNKFDATLNYTDPNERFAMQVNLNYDTTCFVGEIGSMARGLLHLTLGEDQSTLFSLNATYYYCAELNEVQWLINGTQEGVLQISSVSIHDATIELQGERIFGSTFWNGTVTGAFKIADRVTAEATVTFDSNAVNNLHATATFNTTYVEIKVEIDYTADPECLDMIDFNYTSLSAYNVSTFVGQVGTCEVKVKGVGDVDLVLAGTIAHDKCLDVWYIDAYVAEPWQVEGLTLDTLNVTILGQRYSKDVQAYKWTGYVESSASISSLGFGDLVANVSVEFDSFNGLNAAIVKLHETSSIGDIDLMVKYDGSAACGKAVNSLTSTGAFQSTFSNDDLAVGIYIVAEYDLCTKDWAFYGNTSALTIYKFSVTNAEVTFDRIYHDPYYATYEHLVVQGQIQLSDFVAQVYYNYTQPILIANISYTGDVIAMNLTNLVYTPIDCEIEEDMEETVFSGNAEVSVLLLGSPLQVQGSVEYYECLDNLWRIDATTTEPWEPLADLTVNNVALVLNKSINPFTEEAIYHGILHGEVVFYGIETTTDIEFTESELISMTLLYNYTGEFLVALSWLNFEKDCSAVAGYLAHGDGTIELMNIADNGNIKGLMSMSYYGSSCSNDGLVWELNGNATVSDLQIYGAPLNAQLAISVANISGVISGHINGNMTYFGLQAAADAYFNSQQGLTALFVQVQYTDPRELIQLDASLQYNQSCVGDFGNATVVVIGIDNHPTLFLNATHYRCAGEGETAWVIKGSMDRVPILSAVLTNVVASITGNVTATGIYWYGTISGYENSTRSRGYASISFNSIDGVTALTAYLSYTSEYVDMNMQVVYVKATESACDGHEESILNATAPGFVGGAGTAEVIVKHIGTTNLTMTGEVIKDTCVNHLEFVGNLSEPFVVESFTLNSVMLTISQYDNVTYGTLQGEAYIDAIGLTTTLTTHFNSDSGIDYLSIAFTRLIASFGEFSATMIYNSSACEMFVGTGDIVSDPDLVTFDLIFHVNATINDCENTLELYGVTNSTFFIDDVLMGAGALVHVLQDQDTEEYIQMQIQATAHISGALVEVFYDIPTQYWYILFNYTSDYFSVNASLVHQLPDCAVVPYVPQFHGIGDAIVQVGESSAIFSVNASYVSCDKSLTVGGQGNTFGANGVNVINPVFDVGVYNSSLVLVNYTRATYVNGTIFGGAELTFGTFFDNAAIYGHIEFDSVHGLKFVNASLLLNSSLYTFNFNVQFYGQVECAPENALKALGEGTFVLHIAEESEWIIGASVHLFNPCDDSSAVPATVIKGYTELSGNEFMGLPLNAAAYVTYVINADGSEYFEFAANAMIYGLVADVFANATVPGGTDSLSPQIDVFHLTFNYTDPSGFFNILAIADYNSVCDVTTHQGINVITKANFSLGNAGSFEFNLNGQYYSCAKHGEVQWILNADVTYNTPLAISGLTLTTPTVTLEGTKNVSSSQNRTMWIGTISGDIGGFLGLADLNATVALQFSTLNGLDNLKVHVMFQDEMVLLNVIINWISTSEYDCSKEASFDPETFSPYDPSFSGTFGTAQLQLSNIADSAIIVDAIVAYDTCLDVWWIQSTFELDDNIKGLPINAEVDIKVIGTRNPKNKGKQSYDWTIIFDGYVNLVDYELSGNLTVIASTTNGVETILLDIVDHFDVGTLQATVLYQYHAPDNSLPAIPGSTCPVGESKLIAGTGSFELKMPPNDTGVLNVAVSRDLCNKNWNITGTASNLKIYDLTISSIYVDIMGVYSAAAGKVEWTSIVAGALTFDKFAAKALVYVDPLETLFYIKFQINDYTGVYVNVSLLYQKVDSISVAVGTADVLFDGLGGGGKLELKATAIYCSHPLTPSSASIGSNYPYKFYIKTYTDFDFGMYGRNVGQAALVLARPAAIVNYEIELQPWEFKIIGYATFPELGQGSLSGSVVIVIAQSKIQDFIINVDTSFGRDIDAQLSVHIEDPGKCKPGNKWYGDGKIIVRDLPGLDTLDVKADWEMACDGSGQFGIDLDVAVGAESGFSALGMDFTVGNVAVKIARATKNAPIFVDIIGALSGIDNLDAKLHFSLPLNEMEVSVEYISAAGKTTRNGGLSISTPGHMLAVLGKSSSDIKSSANLNPGQVIPPASGTSSNMYYDMLTRVDILAATVKFDLKKHSVYVYASVNLYGAVVDLFFHGVAHGRKPAFAIGVALDLTRIRTDNLPKPIAFLEDINLSKLIFAYSSMSGTFEFGPNAKLGLLANTFMMRVEITLGNPALSSFTSNLDSSTVSNIQNAGNGGKLYLQASINPNEVLFLLGFSGNLNMGDFQLRELYLSLSLTMPVPSFSFGIVGMMSMNLGHETKNGVTRPVTVTALAQLFVDISPLGAGLGFMVAVCREPWEIIPGIYINFPIKLKAVINLQTALPQEVNFAGGFALGKDPNTNINAYAQVMADIATSEYSIYFSMERVSFGTLVETFVGGGVKIPSAFHSIISIGSVTVSFNPSFSAMAPTQTEAPTASSLVAQSSGDCDNIFNLMQFQPIPGGILLQIKDLRIFGDFIVVNEVTVHVDPGNGIYALVNLAKITSIPGITITDYTGTTGPQFELTLMKTDFKLYFSGKFDFLNFIKLGAMFVVSPEFVSATANLQIVPGVTLDFFFEFSPKNPLNGLSFYVAFNDPDRRLIAGIIEAVNALFTTAINGVQTAREAMAYAVSKLEETKAVLSRAKQTVSAAFAPAIEAVSRAQARAESTAATCRYLGSQCKWYKFWNCIAAGFCWIGYGFEQAGLWIAKMVLMAIEAIINAALTLASYAVGVAQIALKLASEALGVVQLVLKAVNLLIGEFLKILDKVIWIRHLSFGGKFYPKSGISVQFAFDIELFGLRIHGNFQCNLDFKNILKSLADAAIGFIKQTLSQLTGGLLFKRTSPLIDVTNITMPIAEVCVLVERTLETPALVFHPLSVEGNASLPSCIFESFENISTLSFSGIGLIGEIPIFTVPYYP